MSSDAVTRTGKYLYHAGQSDLHERNPCPQATFLRGLPLDYIDAQGRQYWRVAKHEKLRDWLAESRSLQEQIESVFDDERDVLCFVKKDKESVKLNATFVLAEEGEQLQLTTAVAAQNKKAKASPNAKTATARVLANGQSASTSANNYKARSVQWTILRDLVVEEEDDDAEA
jgi:hypothetical protein